MSSELNLGTVAGLRLSARPSAVVASVLCGLLLSRLIARQLAVSRAQALVGGFLAVALHWASDLAHHLGHARAARNTGYPMTGVQFWGLIGTSLYPPDEPALPGSVHRRRALGGPIASLLLGLAALPVAGLLRGRGGLPAWLATFVVVQNLGTLGLGAFMPLPITDGGTLLRWRGKP